MMGREFYELWNGLLVILHPQPAFMLLVGCLAGLFIGIIPGLGTVFALAVLLPFVYGMQPAVAFCLMMGIYASTNNGGSITSILINTPGTGPNAATCLDGFSMTRNGEAARAVGAAQLASVVGGIFGAIALAILIPIMRPLVMSFGNPEFLMMALLGIIFIGVLGTDNPRRGIIAGAFGLLVSLVGYDPVTGIARFTFGSIALEDGLTLVSVAVGLFAGAEMLDLGYKGEKIAPGEIPRTYRGFTKGVRDVIRHWALVLQCSVIGTMIGIVPGLGGDVATFIAYGHAKQTSKNRDMFGNGAVEGVIAPESSSNAKEGGALMPTLAFGVPGSASMAILLGAFMVLGIDPGPEMMTTHLNITFSLVWDLIIANIFCAAFILALAPFLIRVSYVRTSIIVPAVFVIITLGSYAVRNSISDVTVALIFSVIGYFMKKFEYPRAAVVLGVVLARIFDANLHLTLQLYGWSFLFTRPIAMIIFGIIVLTMAFQIRAWRRKQHTGEA